ncbi:Non-histone chromosomal protein 6 [Hypoxylon texense]
MEPGWEKLTWITSQIIDDGYQHVLMVFEDAITGGCRLHAAVWEGKLRACPVWTAFIPPNVSSSWLLRKTKRRIWLRDIQPYVFCEKYRPTHQRRGRVGAFELAFAHSEAATRFQELFAGTPDASAASAAPESTEGNDAAGPANPSERSTEVNVIGEIGS